MPLVTLLVRHAYGPRQLKFHDLSTAFEQLDATREQVMEAGQVCALYCQRRGTTVNGSEARHLHKEVWQASESHAPTSN